jgi:hypothetical protein
MSFNANDYKDLIMKLYETGILQALKACDDKKLTGRLILEIEYNQGGIRSVIREAERIRLK